jgi:serine/threonine protein kinase
MLGTRGSRWSVERIVGPVKGTRLVERYRLDDLIGAGGVGDVWRGTDEVDGRTVAVKLLTPWPLHPRFADYLRLGWLGPMAQIGHPDVVHALDAGEDPDAGAFVVTEYLPGESLAVVLDREGAFSPIRTMDLVARAAGALQAVHALGVVHREVWPGRLLVRPDGTVALTAFGLERIHGANSFPAVSIERAAYIPPELARGEAPWYPWDIYGLGAVAYRCLAGRRPFGGQSAIEVAYRVVVDAPLRLAVPAPVRAVVERAMAKEPADRWPSAGALAAAARAAAAEQ